jgi:hypothetical protein
VNDDGTEALFACFKSPNDNLSVGGGNVKPALQENHARREGQWADFTDARLGTSVISFLYLDMDIVFKSPVM